MFRRKVTRGFGLLEFFFSIKRMQKALELIKKYDKNGKILDIGCGVYPLLLINSNFNEKYGIDKAIKNQKFNSLNLEVINYNILNNSILSFEKSFFDVITVLAVVEHLNFVQLNKVLKECYNALKKDGILIITTPAKWSDIILRILAKFKIVSSEEINDHKNTFNFKEMIKLLIKANFKFKNIQKGYFEFYFNLWICAKK